MSVLKGEGTTVILYGTTNVSTGARAYRGYLARPDLMGEWPTVVLPSPSYEASSSVHAICRDLARNGIAAVAPDTDGLDAFIGFITNPAGHWSNAEYGFGILSVGDGSTADATVAVASGLVSSLALVDPTLDQAALGLLTEVAVPVLGCSGRVGLAGLEDARAAAPHAEWVVYDGVGAQYWNINAEGYDQVAAEDTRDRVIEFFAESLPVKI